MAFGPIEIQVGDRAYQVMIDRDEPGSDRFQLMYGERTRVLDVRDVQAGTLSLIEVGGGAESHVARITDIPRRGELDVHVNGAVVRVVVGRGRMVAGEGVGAGSTGPREIVAPMPGKIVRLLVSEGEVVTERQGLVVVEAMKMENELPAPNAGRVARVLVREGASVEAGKVLLVIE